MVPTTGIATSRSAEEEGRFLTPSQRFSASTVLGKAKLPMETPNHRSKKSKPVSPFFALVTCWA